MLLITAVICQMSAVTNGPNAPCCSQMFANLTFPPSEHEKNNQMRNQHAPPATGFSVIFIIMCTKVCTLTNEVFHCYRHSRLKSQCSNLHLATIIT